MAAKYYRSNKYYNQGDWVIVGELYYESQVDDNKDKPTEGTAKEPKTWDGGYTKDEYEGILSEGRTCRDNNEDCHGTNDRILSLDDIPELCDGDKISVGDLRKYERAIYVACKDMDCSRDYPDSRDWEGPFGIEDMLRASLSPCEDESISFGFEVWSGACNADDNCVIVYDKNICVFYRKDKDSPYLIYRSRKDDNHSTPGENEDWGDGETVCEYLNRPIFENLNGHAYPDQDVEELPVLIASDEIDADSLEMIEIDGKKVLSAIDRDIRYTVEDQADGKWYLVGKDADGVEVSRVLHGHVKTIHHDEKLVATLAENGDLTLQPMLDGVANGAPIVVPHHDGDLKVTKDADGTITFQPMMDGVAIGSPISQDHHEPTVDTFSSLDKVVDSDGNQTITFYPADGSDPTSFTITAPCDAAWMLPRRAATNKNKIDVMFIGDKASAVAVYDAAGTEKRTKLGTVTLTDTDLKGLGKRTTDNTAVVSVMAFAEYWSGASDPAAGAELELQAKAEWTHVATDSSVYVAVEMGNKDDDRDSASKLIDFAIADGEDLNIDLTAVLKNANEAQVNDTQLSDNFQVRWKLLVTIARFYHSDDGTATVEGGCLKK